MPVAEKPSRQKLEVLKTNVLHVRGIIFYVCYFFIQKFTANS